MATKFSTIREPERLHIRFSDCGRHIRQWSREPFEGARAYSAAPTLAERIAGWSALVGFGLLVLFLAITGGML